ncbi:helix-turn-helix domain-containing protein [Sinosporangium siamense]|uniref:HTH cro/C1-type domain-containing protein n=1 Tax=Sinosporangium siamense TaxID=1367973 RepID=A0A919RMK4_9ACTN|nr:helix-turn-helix transcriptional regulator [Sinosporangium siamense]GII95189.1 hypothetical protein Ssi02_54200 [Sinosporangium siamense]
MITGADLRRARERADVSLDEMASRIGMSTGHLSRVERGQRAISPTVVQRYREALGPEIAANITEITETAADSSSLDDDNGMLSAIAAACVGASVVDTSVLLDDLMVTPNAVGMREVKALEEAVEFYTKMDLSRGGEPVIAIARGALVWAVGLLDGQMTDPVRDHVVNGIGLLADRLGWALYDLGDTVRARRMLTFALNFASRGSDRDLRAHIMLDLSVVLADSGKPRAAVEVLRMALGDERISLQEKANLHAVAARHCAYARDRDSGIRHISLAEESLAQTRSEGGPEWARRVTASPGHHESALGLAYFALDMLDQAQGRLSAALAKLGSERVRTALRCRTRLAVIFVKNRDLARAVSEIERCFADAESVKSARIRADLLMVLEAMRNSEESVLIDLADRLTPSAPSVESP